MSCELVIRNRQHTRALDIPLLRRITRHLLETQLGVRSYQLGIHLVEPTHMARINQRYLGHRGSTDVITFDHGGQIDGALHGELFISISDAVAQGSAFRTTWQSEVVRYIVHGVLHLRGYDDLAPDLRRVMKREENRLLKQVVREFAVTRIAKPRA